MTPKNIYIGENILRKNAGSASGEIVIIDKEKYYKISGYDNMPPFLMNIVSDSDLWMFISSSGALTAGRQNPDNALFPYYTDDRIHDSHEITGSKTILFAAKDNKNFLWQPFSETCSAIYSTERNIYKNFTGSKLIFEEINFDLSLSFSYSWSSCEQFGFIKKAKITNNGGENISINILDGIQNILPYGTDRKFQLEFSTLLDGYKKNELLDETGLALFTLSSVPTDKAEPSEALRATIAWSTGLSNSAILLSSRQLELFKKGNQVCRERNVRGVRGAYFLNSEFVLPGESSTEWYIAADVSKNHSDIAEISSMLSSNKNLKQEIEYEIGKDSAGLISKAAGSDGLQLTNDPLISSRHLSNVMFNIMRGGIPDDNYKINKKDFDKFILNSNYQLHEKYSAFIGTLPDRTGSSDLQEKIDTLNDADFLRLYYEYLPLTFSRRHGDPSRPWNLFSINIKDENGNKVLNYQGNWRDIFQNWEALALSFPGFIGNMIVKFLNASTADGYNPYIVTKNGFDWEVLNPSDAWSHIGYWGDHQVIYLLKLLELSEKFYPETLSSYLNKEIFTYANVPYKIKTYKEIVADPHNTIEFDFKLDKGIREKVKETGGDGKYLNSRIDQLYHVNFSEKLLVLLLSKLTNFIPCAGIWMNTQRPEWNDANNALVGYGSSMVTLYHLRRFVVFCSNLFSKQGIGEISVSEEVIELFGSISDVLTENKNLLNDEISGCSRKRILDGLGLAGSAYRLKIYQKGFSGIKKQTAADRCISFFRLVLEYIDHSIKANRRDDNLYHAYNLIKFTENNEIVIRRLYEMLEGQAAVLSSGFLAIDESIALLNSLKKSRLYREDQDSYLLYPDRELPGFLEKNIIPEELILETEFLKNLVKNNDKKIVVKDNNGKYHFNSRFRNSSQLKEFLNNQLNSHTPSESEKKSLLHVYESVFDHQSFTGRSGTFYKYEGLGCIYWHMVSKLQLAVQETFFRAVEENADEHELRTLKNIYYEIRGGTGAHKQPALYGAFPTDPYSHTPSYTGAQQPGMTGQVKEDIISRFGELGLTVSNGEIHFNTCLLNENEFLTKSDAFQYYDVNGDAQTLIVSAGMLVYTFCQIPVIYIKSEEQKIILTYENGNEEELDGLRIKSPESQRIFRRDGSISKIKVLINTTNI